MNRNEAISMIRDYHTVDLVIAADADAEALIAYAKALVEDEGRADADTLARHAALREDAGVSIGD